MISKRFILKVPVLPALAGTPVARRKLIMPLDPATLTPGQKRQKSFRHCEAVANEERAMRAMGTEGWLLLVLVSGLADE
jgi:hypothetical protein